MNKSIWNNRKVAYQFLKFSLIGVLNTGIHYGIFFVLFRFAAVYYLTASVIGYCAGLLNSYAMNKKWTFGAKGARRDIEFAKFIAVNLVALLANVGSLKILVSYLRLIPEVAQVFAIGFSMAVNFLGNLLWTFRQKNVMGKAFE